MMYKEGKLVFYRPLYDYISSGFATIVGVENTLPKTVYVLKGDLPYNVRYYEDCIMPAETKEKFIYDAFFILYQNQRTVMAKTILDQKFSESSLQRLSMRDFDLLKDKSI